MKKIILMLGSVLFMTISMFAQWDIDEGFEGGSIPNDWTIYDNDNDGYQWEAYWNPALAHTGNYSAKIWVNLGPTAPNDDWLITPQVSIQSGDSLIFWAIPKILMSNFHKPELILETLMLLLKVLSGRLILIQNMLMT
ncbi:MAG: choice-of-anchor J domain-containing protein [Bacteroidales bacterium]|nr:choice-of-anchor J domain-containing protein [Bacteroidales bacterium]